MEQTSGEFQCPLQGLCLSSKAKYLHCYVQLVMWTTVCTQEFSWHKKKEKKSTKPNTFMRGSYQRFISQVLWDSFLLSSDEVQWSVESTFSIHILPVFSLLGYVDSMCIDWSISLPPLCGAKATKSHYFHHLDLLFCFTFHICLWDLNWLRWLVFPFFLPRRGSGGRRARSARRRPRRTSPVRGARAAPPPVPVSWTGTLRSLPLPAPPLAVPGSGARTSSLSSWRTSTPTPTHFHRIGNNWK